jgi:tetratricopeptide (TPR) repeat protein
VEELERTLQRAREAHEAGRLEDAEAGYRRALVLAPVLAEVRHLLGVVLFQRGDLEQAAGLLAEACRQAPDSAEFARNQGLVLGELGRVAEAGAAFQRALELEPQDPRSRLQLASLHHRAGDAATALRHYRLALERLPELAELHHQVALCHLQLGDPQAALAALDQCLAREPNHAHARESRGRALLVAGRVAEAGAELEALLNAAPRRAEAQRLLGYARLHQGRMEEAAAHFLAPAHDTFAPGGPGGDGPADARTVSRTKLRHDLQQLEWLRAEGVLAQDLLPVIEAHRAALGALPEETPERFLFEVPDVAGFPALYNRWHVDRPAPRVAGGAVRPRRDAGEVAAGFQRDGWAVVDDFLTPPALAALRRFCVESSVWFEKKFPNEVGASLRNGFCCPLLLQIASEIRQVLPGVFGAHLFTGLFSYKYLGRGTVGNVHADRGAVSLNLWITDDAANEEPQRGGLVFWNKRVPPEYFSEDPDLIDRLHQRLLSEPDARPSVVPYRANRALVFHSDVLHRTDRVCFRDDHGSRRVSITYLYGRPGDAG